MFKIIKYLKPYRQAALLAPLLMLVEVAADLLLPTLMATIVDEGIVKGNLLLITRTGYLMVGIAFIGMLGGLGCIVASRYAGISFGTDLRSSVYQKVQQFSFANIDKFSTASLITRMTNDIAQVQMIVMMSLRMLARAPLLSIGGLIMAVGINSRLALIFLITIPLLIISQILIIKKGFPLFTQVQQKLDKVNAVVRENLTGIRVVKAFVRADREKSRFGTANKELTDFNITASRLMILSMPLMMLIMNFSVVAIIWFGGIQASQGNILVGQVMAFINYLVLILHSLLMLTVVLMMFSRAKVSADRINEVLKTETDIMDAPDASSEPIKKGGIVFENVSFSYNEGGSEPVLKDLSFSVEPGEKVAILGRTGSGKSTLVHLIPRLYNVTEGRILIDGRDVRKVKLQTLREGIGMVLQEAVLFTGSIKDNLRWGNSKASDEELFEAAEAAQADDFIKNFKEGYETFIGQRGVNVSGGQKQRLSIARALIKKPAILILDDSTSAVDVETEARLQEALKGRLKNTTCLMIAQRISTVLGADKILVLDEGKIVAQGTPDELLKTSPIYRDIYRSQLGEEEEKCLTKTAP